MSTQCEDFLDADISRNCDEAPKGGIEVNAVIIAVKDIDRTNSVKNTTNKILLDKLQLNAGSSGHFIEGIKQAQGVNYELVAKPNLPDGFKHTFEGVVLSPSAANKLALQKILSGVGYAVVIERKWKGTALADAFEVYGFGAGLFPTSAVGNSKENDGVSNFSLASMDGYEEGTLPLTLLESDYATTKAAFDNKFAQAEA